MKSYQYKLASSIAAKGSAGALSSAMQKLKNYLGSKSQAGAIGTGAGIFGTIGLAKNLALLKGIRSASGGGHSYLREGVYENSGLDKLLKNTLSPQSAESAIAKINPVFKDIGELALDPDALKAYGLLGGVGAGIGALKGGLIGNAARKAALRSQRV